jgi:hypothetical protein
LKKSTEEGESPVLTQSYSRSVYFLRVAFFLIGALTGDRFHPRLNINEIPIAYKYREGKMKRTLKRELKVTEIAEREVDGLDNQTKLLFVTTSPWFRLTILCMDSKSDQSS